MKTLQDYKKDSTLNKVIRYSEGIMTRREWLKMQMIKGATVKEAQVPLLDYNRIKFNRLEGAAQDEYWNKCQQMKTGYQLHLVGGSFYDITKTEYDYFNTLMMKEDVNTQKNDLNERIAAGTATDKEEEESMIAEFEFAAKYF